MQLHATQPYASSAGVTSSCNGGCGVGWRVDCFWSGYTRQCQCPPCCGGQSALTASSILGCAWQQGKASCKHVLWMCRGRPASPGGTYLHCRIMSDQVFCVGVLSSVWFWVCWSAYNVCQHRQCSCGVCHSEVMCVVVRLS